MTAAMPARLPIRLQPSPGEALDGYLERVAAANHLDNAQLLRRLPGTTTTFLPLAPAAAALQRIAALSGQQPAVLARTTLAGLAGIDFQGLDPAKPRTWRRVAARGWAPGRGSQLCSLCLANDGQWRVHWRHPWVTVCPSHSTWLHAECPNCGLPFRSQRHAPLRSVDADSHWCGNPEGARGQACRQELAGLTSTPAPSAVLKSQRRIQQAIHHHPIRVIGSRLDAADYLAEVRSLAVLLLHLACHPGADQLADWCDDALHDRNRSAGDRTARWGLAPPANPVLRGQALGAADAILCCESSDAAAERFGAWIDLAPQTPEGQLGWVADRTTMTSTLTTLVMSSTSTRRRLATRLRHGRRACADDQLPQLLPADLYDAQLAGMLDVREDTGRLFASLCLARLGTARTWGSAAATLGLAPESGVKVARACSADLLVPIPCFLAALSVIDDELADGDSFREREYRVRHLATTTRWYGNWARENARRAHGSSRRYAVNWLWDTFAGGHQSVGPGWDHPPPTSADRALQRRWAERLEPRGASALLALAHDQPKAEADED